MTTSIIKGPVVEFDSVEAAIAYSNGEPTFKHEDGTISLSSVPLPKPEPSPYKIRCTGYNPMTKTVDFDIS